MTLPEAEEPPHDTLAEQAVLGGMMTHPTTVAVVTELLTVADFYRPAHQPLFTAIVGLTEYGTEPNITTVCDALRKTGDLKRCGGEPQIRTIRDAGSDILPGSAAHYAGIVANHSVARRILQAGHKLTELVTTQSGAGAASDLIEAARAAIDEATDEHRHRQGPTGIDLPDAITIRLTEYHQPSPPGLLTGWPEIDEALGAGLRPGSLTIVGARSGNCKSLFAIALAVSASRRGVGSLLASVEMSRDEIVDRVLGNLAGIDTLNLANHRITDEEWSRLHLARRTLRDTPMRIEDSATLSVTRLRSLARDQTRRPCGLGLVVADYLQLMQPVDTRIPRHEQVASISRSLKRLADDFKVPVVAAAQLNREVEKRPGGRPKLSDLRESGALEQDSAYVVLLHREPDKPNELSIELAKNRFGPNTSVIVPLQAKYARIGRHLEVI